MSLSVPHHPVVFTEGRHSIAIASLIKLDQTRKLDLEFDALAGLSCRF